MKLDHDGECWYRVYTLDIQRTHTNEQVQAQNIELYLVFIPLNELITLLSAPAATLRTHLHCLTLKIIFLIHGAKIIVALPLSSSSNIKMSKDKRRNI